MTTRTILLVDDDINILKSVVRVLRREQIDVRAAESAFEALELMKEHDFHLVITDLRMPGMDGLEFLAIVTERYPKTLQVMLSGNADKPDLERAMSQCQVRHFMTKPWNVDELKTLAAQLLDEAEYMRMSL